MPTGTAFAGAKDLTVGEIAAACPATLEVFDKYRLDYACGGKHTLAEICRLAGLAADDVSAEIERAMLQPAAPGPDWTTVPLTLLTGHIVDECHHDQRMRLHRLRALAAALPASTAPLTRMMSRYAADLGAHAHREERHVFPAIVAMERSGAALVPAQLRYWIGSLEREHHAAALVFAEFERLIDAFDGATGEPPFPALRHELKEFETRMRVHLHLENNILFPRLLGPRTKGAPPATAEAVCAHST
jgi:regulator of cell morphogenesis and NO signaling